MGLLIVTSHVMRSEVSAAVMVVYRLLWMGGA
jgi:hypothetical protein